MLFPFPYGAFSSSLTKKARRTMAVHHRANGYVAVCIEPDGGCATMLFFEKWSDHHHAAMQARLLAGHDIQAADTPLPSKSERSERRRQ